MEILLQGLSKSYGKKKALDGINLEIGNGMFGLLGRNGAGKTTLMRILATLSQKTSGNITVGGIPIENTTEIRRITGYLPQDFSMYPRMTVADAMDYLGVLSELSGPIRKKRTELLLEQVNLSDAKNVRIKALSGGMRRRLGIAQALLHDPRVLIADEPTAGLDPEERIRFRNLLCELAQNRIVLLSTHIAGDIEASCERTAVLDNGKLLFNGNITELSSKATGKVWNLTVERDAIAAVKRDYTILSMQSRGTTADFRLLADHRPEGAVPCEPSTEDGYIELMRQAGEVNPTSIISGSINARNEAAK